MKKIQIKTEKFFELLKLHDCTMWDIFEKMIAEDEQQIIFLNNEEEVVGSYILPSSKEQLMKDKKTFNTGFLERLRQN